MCSCLATQGKDLNKSTKKNYLIPKTAWTALEVVAGSRLSVVWFMLQNFAHKALWHPQLSPISWKKSLLQTHIWLQKRVFPGLALAVGGGGANRTTENCSLVAYAPPHLGALAAESPAPLGRAVPQACVCCHPLSLLLSSLAGKKHWGWFMHVSLLSPAPGDTAHYVPRWQLALPLSAGMRWVLARRVMYALPVPKWSLSLVKWLWYIDKWS